MTYADIALIVLGALAGGFVNGLTGFGTALTALPFWLFALAPPQAAQLAAAASVIGQVRTLPAVWSSICAAKVLPFILPGLAGIPIGLLVLPHVPVAVFKLGVGVTLVLYASVMLLARSRLRVTRGGIGANMTVGFLGGVLGGLAGLSGVLPTIWATVRGYGKEEKRALFQSYNLAILSAMLAASLAAGQMAISLATALAVAIPGTLLGNALGMALYRRMSDLAFDRLVLTLLLLAGMTLVGTNV